MSKNRVIEFTITCALVLSIHPTGAQSTPASGLYQINSGTFIECCGIAGDFRTSLPDEKQGFIKLAVDPQNAFVTMTFLGRDARTVFGVLPCPPGDPVNFSFDHGFVFEDGIEFHVDPGPPPYSVYWNYSVSNSTDTLRINGTLGMAQQNCADFSTQFTHSNVVAVLVPGPRLGITEFSKDGALLFIQGQANRTNVIEASMDLVSWTPISTNVMPPSLCPVCPYLLYRDTAGTNLVRRFYRCFEIP